MDSKKKNLTVCILFGLLLAVAFLACLFLPKEATSDSERRKLAAMPAFTLDTVLSGRFMSGFETYTQDHFPFRDQFRTLKALSATGLFHRQDNNGIYVSDGFAAAVEYPLNESSLDRAAGRFQYLYDKYLNGSNRVFLSVIPDKNCFLARESGHLSMDYAQLESLMAQKVGFADYISISDLLERDDYYRTDTHWRQERITDVAERLAQAMELPGGVYNFGSENDCDMVTTARRACALLDIHPVIETADWPRSLLMDGGRLRAAAGVGFDDTLTGVQRCLRDYGLLK